MARRRPAGLPVARRAEPKKEMRQVNPQGFRRHPRPSPSSGRMAKVEIKSKEVRALAAAQWPLAPMLPKARARSGAAARAGLERPPSLTLPPAATRAACRASPLSCRTRPR